MGASDSKEEKKEEEKKKNEKSALVEKEGKARSHDPNFKGPIQNRSCTDVICCILFIVFILGLIVLGGWAFYNGDYRKIIYPTDSNGQICGIEVKDRPVLYFFDIVKCFRNPVVTTTGCPTPQVCLKKCPDYYFLWVTAFAKEKTGSTDTDGRGKMICVGGKNANAPEFVNTPIDQLVQRSKCAPYVLKTTTALGRCIPMPFNVKNITDAAGKTVNSTEVQKGSKFLATFLLASQFAQNVLKDLVTSWHIILIMMAIGVLTALLWVILMRFLAAIMVWLTLLLFVIIFAFLTGYSFYRYYVISKGISESSPTTSPFTSTVEKYLNMKSTWLAFGIISGVVLLIILILLIFLRSRIRIAVALIKEASKAISYMMSTLFWPFIPFIMEVLVLALCLAVGIYLASVGKPSGRLVDSNATLNGSVVDTAISGAKEKMSSLLDCDPSANTTKGKICQFVKYDAKQYILVFQFYNIFMYFWLFNFIIALGQMTLAGSFASYYFAFSKPKDIPSLPLLSAFWRSIRYHLGTLAFGSLLIAIVQVIRAILEYIEEKTKEAQNPCAQFLVKCLQCCFWCLEKFLKMLTKNAFIITAIYGENFCSAAKDAFSLILRNVVRVFVVDKVTDMVIIIGKLVVVGLVGALAFFYFDGTIARKVSFFEEYTPTLNYIYIPIIIIVISTYIVASLFFSVYDMAVDTLFLCFLEDLERNDGSPEKPYYMSKELMRILGKHNVKPAKSTESVGKADSAL